MELFKKLARMFFGEYSAYCIYSQSTEAALHVRPEAEGKFSVRQVDESAIRDSSDSLIREQAEYAGPGSCAYACFDGDRIVGLCFYWFGSRYLQRNYWPLAEGEVKLVQIVSIPEMRGRGVATRLIASSFQDLVQKGFRRAYARIWHSNTPSRRAFERAGWKKIALVVEVNPLRRSRPIRVRFDTSIPTRGMGA